MLLQLATCFCRLNYPVTVANILICLPDFKNGITRIVHIESPGIWNHLSRTNILEAYGTLCRAAVKEKEYAKIHNLEKDVSLCCNDVGMLLFESLYLQSKISL